jgi:uncharacterized protein YbjT (DUF2867 family)
MMSYFISGPQAENVFVSCADNKLGFYAAMAMQESRKFQKVIAGVQDREDQFSKKLEQMGCELREWNLDDKRSLEKALNGMKNILLLPTHREQIKQDTENILEAVRSNNIQNAVFWSKVGVDHATEEEKHFQQLKEVEDMVKRSGIQNIVVTRIGFTQQMLFLLSRYIQDRGILPLPTGRGKFAPVSLRDCGHATAEILCSDMNQHKHQTYQFTGTQLLTGRKLVEHANRVLQAEIEYEDISLDEFRNLLKENKEVNEKEVECIVEMMKLVKEGKYNTRTNDLNKIMGREPMDIERFFRDNASSFRPSGTRYQRLALIEHDTKYC